ncbi:MAG TPA: glutamine synthetase [Pseudonocardia sp.]|jgi:glutamine synthetase|nr:glutamine synthetase [Pseudonocardia sp.]
MSAHRLPATTADVGHTMSALKSKGVTMLAIGSVDDAGVSRVEGVPVERLVHLTREGLQVSRKLDGSAVDDSCGRRDGDLRLVPDLARLVPLSEQPGWAWAPADAFDLDGSRSGGCQRWFAATQVAAAEAAGLSVRMAFESEWSLVAPSSPSPSLNGTAMDEGRWAGADHDAATHPGQVGLGQVAEYGRELVATLGALGLRVQQFHPEHAPARLGLSVVGNGPLGAADDVVLLRDAVRQVSARHGRRASFAPIVEPGAPGCGARLRLSVHDADGSTLADGTRRYLMRPVGEAFLAGVLRELPALCALGAAHPASYLRLRPSQRAGAWQCWSRESREAALRLVGGVIGTGKRSTHAEVRSFDASGNPYLVVGGVLAAGLAGVREELRLPLDTCGDPGELSDHERAAAGILRLPTSLTETAEAFADSSVLAEAMGETLHGSVLAMRRADGKRYSDTMPDHLAALSRWRY